MTMATTTRITPVVAVVSMPATMLMFLLSFLLSITSTTGNDEKPINLVFILTDQQRYDAIQFVQEELAIQPSEGRIRTPNLDRLLNDGAYFRNAYTHNPVCVSARTSILTGRTIENTGVRSNYGKTDEEIKNTDAGLKLPQLRTYDEILVENHGYVAEYYGKWHMAEVKGRVYNNDVTANNADYTWFGKYEADGTTKHYAKGLRPDYYDWLDDNNIKRCQPWIQTPLFDGVDCVPDGFSKTVKHSGDAIEALRRLGTSGNAFSIHLSIVAPHPPYTPTDMYYDMYDPRFVPIPENLYSTLENSGYETRRMIASNKVRALRDHSNLQRLRATYYGFVTEIDEKVGTILSTIDELGIADNTMVVFTSDHGDMLGDHAMMGKYVLYEGSVRVPLLMRLPGKIDRGVVVDEPVSLLDLHSTLLDYLQVGAVYESDGKSLRNHIERTATQEKEEDNCAVSEWSVGKSVDMNSPGYKNRADDHEPAFMIRCGKWKLLMPGFTTGGLDMLFNLENDPHEMNNLIGHHGLSATDEVIGKAEHLKTLILQYLARTKHPDLDVIKQRRTWRSLPFWISDTTVKFKPVLKDGTRTEWIHLGSGTIDSIIVKDVFVEDSAAQRYKVELQESSLDRHPVIAVTYSTDDPSCAGGSMADEPAMLVIEHTTTGEEMSGDYNMVTVKLNSPNQEGCVPVSPLCMPHFATGCTEGTQCCSNYCDTRFNNLIPDAEGRCTVPPQKAHANKLCSRTRNGGGVRAQKACE